MQYSICILCAQCKNGTLGKFWNEKFAKYDTFESYIQKYHVLQSEMRKKEGIKKYFHGRILGQNEFNAISWVEIDLAAMLKEIF